MATPEQMEKKRSRQVEEILEAVKMTATEIAELKAGIGKTDVIELKAEFDETADRTDEILAAIGSMADKAELKTEIYGLKQQVAELSSQIAELQAAIAPPPTSRQTKK